MAKQSVLIPLFAFVILVVILGLGFTLSDHKDLPAQRVNEPMPAFSLPSLWQPQFQITAASLDGEAALINVWATWCPSCVAEHAELARIHTEEGIRIVGINYNDDPEAARAFLRRWGDPYAFHIVDAEGTLAVDLGVYGAPETFVIDSSGVIRYRHVGVVTERVFEEKLKPLLNQFKDRS
ncbi:MAG: DsbE family thiol:disulfide interchange protein [Pseudomonadales bacterium]